MTPMHNQDHFVIDEGLWNENTGYLFVIADGIKTLHNDCHIAQLGAEAVYTKYYADISDNRIMALQKAFEYANQEVCETCPNLGTTCTAALFHNETLHVANVGNSRAYRLRDHYLTQITQDHSLAAAFIKLGHVTEDDLRTYPHSSYKLTRWLGSPSAVEVDIFSESLEPKDSILLCTKGVSGWLHEEDNEIAQVLGSHPTEKAAQALMKLVEDAGSASDATAIVIAYQS